MFEGINLGALLSGVITIGSAISVASGHPALGAVISDPATAQAFTAILGGFAGLFSMFSPALLHSTTKAAAAALPPKL